MNTTNKENLNSRNILEQKISKNEIKLWWILSVLPLRFVLALAAQGLTSLIFLAGGDPTPWDAAGE